MSTNTIPPDVKARLLQAAIELMAEQGFTPLSERDTELWLVRNAQAIGERAKELQEQLLVKILGHEREVTAMLSESVYRQIRREAR